MHPARIAELLKPFLGTYDASIYSDHCHSEQRSAEACPERSRRESAFLSTAQLHSISTYIDILLRWNARINLTAIRNPEDIVTRHFGESLFAARHLFPGVGTAAPGCPPERSSAPATAGGIGSVTAAKRRQNAAHGASRGLDEEREPAPKRRQQTTLADLGSGPGFPGIPIKLWAPQISLTLIESNHKKATFLREVARALTLTDINIQTTRAQDLLSRDLVKRNAVPPSSAGEHMRELDATKAAADVHPLFDVITLRAVERFADILPTAAALVAPGGRLALLIGSSQQGHVQANLPNLHWLAPVPVPLSMERRLLIGTRAPRR